MKSIKPEKDRMDGVLIMRLINACNINSVSEARQVVEEIEEFEYKTDAATVLFIRERIDKGELAQIVQRFMHK
ncbi:MAG: hypothetical protein FWD48_06105 [Oscillospiraceae bacterium]|nr:hypothetical protein [Oscillospiraceae bacterium]